jgi:hypothetical protein
MMERSFNPVTRILISSLICGVAIYSMGCSHSNKSVDPISPGASGLSQSSQKDHADLIGRSLLGYWEVTISDDKKVEIVPQRAVSMHLNILKIMEGGVCSDCLLIHEIQFLPDNKFSALMVITHPFPALKEYSGFDVRGIFISKGAYNFPGFGKDMAWGPDVPRMLTYDGYTSLFNPNDYPQTTPPALGYIPGQKATGGDLSSTVNPYIAFQRGNERSYFDPNTLAYRYLQVYAKSHPIHFGYAVEANWQLVPGPINNIDQFPPDANCLEAYKVQVTLGKGIVDGGGSAPIKLVASDHQGLDTIVSVTAEAPDLFAGVITLEYSNEEHCYSGIIANDNHASFGEYPILIRVVDSETDQNLGPVDAWQLYILQIKRGWVLTWGGGLEDFGYDTAIGPAGQICIGGNYTGIVDLDPGFGADIHESSKNQGGYTPDVFLSCFDKAGEFLWARTWGSSGSEICFDIAFDSAGNIYVAGFYNSKVDFDPGDGQDIHTTTGAADAYISKFDSSGNFLWVRTWGGTGMDAANGVAVDDVGGVYIAGFFTGDVDFDPGTGVDSHSSNGNRDSYLMKLDISGSYQWAKTWGGSLGDSAASIASSNMNWVCVSGYFREEQDFNPGPGTDSHTAIDQADVFLSMYAWSGAYIGTYTWGGSGMDSCSDVDIDSWDNIYVTGTYSASADMDPTDGLDVHIAIGVLDAFIMKINSSGEFRWARTWGGSSTDNPTSVQVDSGGNAFITGKFYDVADFDASSGLDNHGSYGLFDAFLCKYDQWGNYQWARTWGSIDNDSGSSVAIDSLGNPYVAGYFKDVTDFDTGTGFDIHSPVGQTDIFLSKYPSDGNW